MSDDKLFLLIGKLYAELYDVVGVAKQQKAVLETLQKENEGLRGLVRKYEADSARNVGPAVAG